MWLGLGLLCCSTREAGRAAWTVGHPGPDLGWLPGDLTGVGDHTHPLPPSWPSWRTSPQLLTCPVCLDSCPCRTRTVPSSSGSAVLQHISPARPGTCPRSGLRPVCHLAGLPSSSWLKSSLHGTREAPTSLPCPPPWRQPLPLQMAAQSHLLLEALPALQAHCPRRLGAPGGTGHEEQPGTGQALGERFVNERNRIQRMKWKTRRPRTKPWPPHGSTSHQAGRSARHPGTRGNTWKEFMPPPPPRTLPVRTHPRGL